MSIFVSSQNELFISDRENHRVVRWPAEPLAKIISTEKVVGSDFHLEPTSPKTEKEEPDEDEEKMIQGETVAGGNGQGFEINQLYAPGGIFLNERILYVADLGNHRIVAWIISGTCDRIEEAPKTRSFLICGGNGRGSDLKQLACPTDVSVLDNKLFVCDWDNHRVLKWTLNQDGLGVTTSNGQIVCGGNGPGNLENQLQKPCGIFIDEGSNIFISDQHNHRIMLWPNEARIGLKVAGTGNPYDETNPDESLSLPIKVRPGPRGSLIVCEPELKRITLWDDVKQLCPDSLFDDEEREHFKKVMPEGSSPGLGIATAFGSL